MKPQDVPPRVVGLEPPPTPAESPRGGAVRWPGLRDYQIEACEAIGVELAMHRSTLLVMATGLGKTITAAAFVHRWKAEHSLWPDSVLWLAHRDELLSQSREQIERLTGELVSLEQADFRGGGTRIMVASIQTLKGKRLEAWAPDRFSLIVVDEAHHAPSPSYRKILDHFKAAKIVGLTATPDRLDGKAQGDVFETVALKRDIDFGITEGYLVPLVLEATYIESIDVGRAKTVMGDLDESTVEEEIVKAVAPIAKAVREATPAGERSLTFTPRVGSAHAVSEALNAHIIESSRCVDGKTEKQLRKAILRDHKRGRFAHLLNCLVFTEGYDDPGVRVGCIARLTKSTRASKPRSITPFRPSSVFSPPV